MRKSITVLTVVAIAVLVVGIAGVVETNAKDSGSKKVTGKTLYKTYCKTCHGPKSPNGEYSPLTLIQSQWERFFDKKLVKSHKDAVLPDQDGKKLLDALDEETLEKIRKFAIDHAADSENPMTCG